MAIQFINKTNSVDISTANPNLDGTGAIQEIFNATGTFGSVLSTIRIQCPGPATMGMIRLFIKNGADGDYKLLSECPIAQTPTSEPPYAAFNMSLPVNINLQNGFRIGVSTEMGNLFNIIAFGYDITGFVL